ncbi:unnamed protein product [Urochloa humidicola]
MVAHGFPPGDVDFRPQVVRAAAARTQEMREEERDLELCTLVAVQRDGLAPVSCEAVLREAPRQLGIQAHEMAVEGLSKAKFLLRFGSLQIRNVALATNSFQVGKCNFSIMKWSRRIGATVGRLRYRVRVCLEGVPRHACNAAAVAQLFSTPSFIDEINCVVEKEEARFCFNLWIWTDAPYDIALQGILQLQEPFELSEQQLYSQDSMEVVEPEPPPLKTFDYEVLIHVDTVLDFTPPSARSSSMLRDDSECPEVFNYTWFLGYKDGDRPARRPSVHDRLGRRMDHSDRSPPRGGNGGGMGLRQRPPGSVFDVARMPFAGQSRHGCAGGSSGYGGRRRNTGAPNVLQRGGNEHVAGARWIWKAKNLACKDSDVLQGPVDGALPNHCVTQDHGKIDPMLDEVACFSQAEHDRSMLPQRSVEPTVAEGAGDVLLSPERSAPLLISEVIGLQGEEVLGTQGGEVADQGKEVQESEEEVQLPQADLVEAMQNKGREDDSSHSREEMQARPFDLNEGPTEEIVSSGETENVEVPHHPAPDADRQVLGMADSRLNKGKELAAPRAQGKGVARFSIPLKKALLCPPAMRVKATHSKKSSDASTSTVGGRKAAKHGRDGLLVGSIEEKASALLLRTAGLLVQDEAPTEAAQHQFAEEFVRPARSELLGDMRTVFRLPGAVGVGPLEVLATDAEN